MSTSTLTSKGQVTIPKEIRETLGLKEHDVVAFVIRGKDVLIKPKTGNILDLRGSIKPRKRPENFNHVRKVTRKIIAKKAAER